MANDERPDEQQEERAFLAGLKARTGRDLAEWMAAIAAHGFHDKNEIIDWLRTQGLTFARASWLERIHRNGGKPIHAGLLVGSDPAGLTPGQTRPSVPPPKAARVPTAMQAVPSTAPPSAQVAPPAAPEQAGRAMGSDSLGLAPVQPAKPIKRPPKSPAPVEPPADPAALEKLVAAAKGYRPLYHHLEAQIRRAIPGAVIAARDRYVAVGGPHEFAAITLHPTEIRLGLALGDRPFDPLLQPAKLRGPGPAITHMAVLTDARQVNDNLLGLLKAASAHVNADGG